MFVDYEAIFSVDKAHKLQELSEDVWGLQFVGQVGLLHVGLYLANGELNDFQVDKEVHCVLLCVLLVLLVFFYGCLQTQNELFQSAQQVSVASLHLVAVLLDVGVQSATECGQITVLQLDRQGIGVVLHNVVALIEDNDAVTRTNVQLISDVLFEQRRIRDTDNISQFKHALRRVVGTDAMSLACLHRLRHTQIQKLFESLCAVVCAF